MTYSIEFLADLFQTIDQYDLSGDLFIRTGPRYGVGGQYCTPASFFLNTGDVLSWGSADVEEITPETLPVLQQCCEDLKALERFAPFIYASSLFACRVQGMRPQHAVYPTEPELWPLFDACGPERPVGLGNPYPHPSVGGPAWDQKKARLAERVVGGFRPRAALNDAGEVTLWFGDDRPVASVGHLEGVLYRSMETGRLVGFKPTGLSEEEKMGLLVAFGN